MDSRLPDHQQGEGDFVHRSQLKDFEGLRGQCCNCIHDSHRVPNTATLSCMASDSLLMVSLKGVTPGIIWRWVVG